MLWVAFVGLAIVSSAPLIFLIAEPMADRASAVLLLREKPRLDANGYYRLVSDLPLYVAVATAVLVAGVVTLAGWFVHRLTGDPRKRRPWARWAFRPFAAILGLSALAIASAWLLETSRLHFAGHRATFLARCGRCHAPSRPLDFIQSRAGWENLIRRMAGKPNAGITEGDVGAVLEYLVTIRSVPTPDLERGRCGRCHSAPRPGALHRGRDDLRRAIERLRALDPRYCEASEADEMTAYLVPGSGGPGPRAAPTDETLERVCESCHFLDVVTRPLRRGPWPDVLARMQEKTPDLLTRQEALALEPVLEAAARDPGAFFRRYPHSDLQDAWRRP